MATDGFLYHSPVNRNDAWLSDPTTAMFQAQLWRYNGVSWQMANLYVNNSGMQPVYMEIKTAGGWGIVDAAGGKP